MEGRGDRDDHGVDARVREEIAVVDMELAAGSRGELLALGSIPTADRDEGGVRQMLGLVFTVGVRLAAPMVLVLLIVELAVGLVSRSAPSLNFMVVGYPVRLVVGLLVLAAIVGTVPQVIASVSERTVDLGLSLAAAFK